MIVAVLKTQIDACADAAVGLASRFESGEALSRWIQRYNAFHANRSRSIDKDSLYELSDSCI